MANFNKESTKKLVKDILTIDESILNNENYINNLDEAGMPDEERMVELFGDNGYEMIKELLEFNEQFNQRHNVAEPTIRQLVTREVYNKFSPDELVDMSINDIIEDSRIDWDVLVAAFESRYSAKVDADSVKKSVGLIIGRNLGSEASFTRANLNQVNNNAEKRLLEEEIAEVSEVAKNEKRKASFFRNTTIGSGVVALGSAAAVVVLAVLLAKSAKTANDYKAQLDKAPVLESYVVSEQAELEDFKDVLNKLGANGLTTAEIQVLENEINNYAQTDNAQNVYSSTGEMRSLLAEAITKGKFDDLQSAYDRLDKKYQTLIAAQPTTPVQAFDYVQFLVEMNDIQELLAKALSDNNFTDAERKDIMLKLAQVDTNKSQIATTLADTFGTTVDAIYETIDYQVAALKSDVAKLTQDVKDLTATVNSQTTIMNQQTATITNQNNTIASLKGDVAKLEGEIAVYELQIQTLEGYIKSLQNQIANSGSNQALLNQLTDALKELNSAKTELNKIKVENGLLVAENNSLKTQLTTLNTQVDTLNKQVDDLTTQNNNLSGEVAKHISQYAELEKKYDELVANYNKEVEKYNKLIEEYKALEEKYNNAGTDAEKEQLKQELAAKAQTIIDLEKQLEENGKLLDELNGKLAKALAENEELINKLAQSDAGFIKALYESLGRNPNGKTQEQMIAELSDLFDLDITPGSSNSNGDLGNQPIK